MRRIETIGFYSTGSASQSSYQVPWDCDLVGVDFAVSPIGTTQADSLIVYIATSAEALSYTQKSQSQILAVCRSFATQLSAAGYMIQSFNKYVPIPEPGFHFVRGQLVWCMVGVNGSATVLQNTVCHFRV